MSEAVPSSSGSVWIVAVFLLVAAPIYLMMRFLVSLVRQAYGFDPVVDDGPPLRVCSQCHNTVLETDYVHCPYCGVDLPQAKTAGAEASATGEQIGDG